MNGPLREQSGRAVLEEAVILHRRAYRETSLLLDICSANFGRLRVLAKGARRGRTPQSHWLRPFVPLRLSWAGRGELPVLTEAEPAGKAIGLAGTALFCGFYMNELLLHLLPSHDPHPEVFRLYLSALRRLGAEPCQEKVLRLFEAALLEAIGYGLTLEREAQGQAIDPAKLYAYVLDQGPIEADVQSTTEEAVHGSTLLGLRRGRLDEPGQLREAKRLLRRVIQQHLNGRSLKSRDLFKAYGASANP
jgi:DNA repair protein RecO (recombination protein O)